jgi:hypothetical protein
MVWKFPTIKIRFLVVIKKPELKKEKIIRKKDNIREGDEGTKTRAIGEFTINF